MLLPGNLFWSTYSVVVELFSWVVDVFFRFLISKLVVHFLLLFNLVFCIVLTYPYYVIACWCIYLLFWHFDIICISLIALFFPGGFVLFFTCFFPQIVHICIFVSNAGFCWCHFVDLRLATAADAFLGCCNSHVGIIVCSSLLFGLFQLLFMFFFLISYSCFFLLIFPGLNQFEFAELTCFLRCGVYLCTLPLL